MSGSSTTFTRAPDVENKLIITVCKRNSDAMCITFQPSVGIQSRRGHVRTVLEYERHFGFHFTGQPPCISITCQSQPFPEYYRRRRLRGGGLPRSQRPL